MGEEFIELERVLRSTEENLTREEKNILRTCKAKAFRAFTFGAGVASGVVWTATRRLRLSYENRLLLSVGAAFMSGTLSRDRSLNSCLDHILALKGSRMQRVLTNLLLTRDNPRTLQLVNNHFYSEKVYDDSTLDQPKSRWRYRNFYGDNVGDNVGQQTHEDNHIHKPDLEPEQLTVSNVYFGQQTHEDNHIHKPDLEPEQLTFFQRTSANDVIVDPLDCILGYAKPGDEIHHADSTGNSLRRKHARGHKKAHRRHRTHHSENP